MVQCSVLILTLNEEANLPQCLEAIKWCDDVVVLDSFSTDRTTAIAEQHEARVFKRKFDNWSAHQNWALQNIPFKHPWVLYIDADEIVEPALAEEIGRVTQDAQNSNVAYWLRRKDMFWGRWLKRSSMYPIWLPRLFKPQHMRYERPVHLLAIIDGPQGRLENHLIHYSFSKGMQAWFIKHTEYARLEAEEVVRNPSAKRLDLGAIFQFRDPVKRRKAMKAASYNLPLRPGIRFLYMYFVRLGILDGWAGFTYSRLISIYEYMIDLNIRELRRRQRGERI